MSLYGKKYKIGGLDCGLVMTGGGNGQYQVVFEREYACLEDIEAVNWARPVIEGECPLPAGFGFTVEDISYSSGTRSYTVCLRVAEQYLGDVAGFQAQVDELTACVAEKEAAIRELESRPDSGQVLLDQLEQAYEEGVERNG